MFNTQGDYQSSWCRNHFIHQVWTSGTPRWWRCPQAPSVSMGSIWATRVKWSTTVTLRSRPAERCYASSTLNLNSSWGKLYPTAVTNPQYLLFVAFTPPGIGKANYIQSVGCLEKGCLSNFSVHRVYVTNMASSALLFRCHRSNNGCFILFNIQHSHLQDVNTKQYRTFIKTLLPFFTRQNGCVFLWLNRCHNS